MGAVFEGVGVSIGSLVGGIMFSKVGGSATFRWFGLGAMVFMVIHVVVQKLYARIVGSFGKDAQTTANGVSTITMSSPPLHTMDSENSDALKLKNTSDSLLLDEQGFKEVPLN